MSYDPEQEPYVALRTKALESLLIEKGLISAQAIDEQVSRYEQDIGPLKGATEAGEIAVTEKTAADAAS